MIESDAEDFISRCVVADYIHVNGQLMEYDTAGIAPGDAGVIHGAGLFETMRARNGKVFRLGAHLARLLASAEAFHLTVSLTEAHLVEMITELLAANGLEGEAGARVRLTVTRGDLHAATIEDPVPPITLILSAGEFGAYPQALYQNGMTVAVCNYKQNTESPLTGHKTTSYLDRLMGLRQAQETKCGEALWFTAVGNHLAEGSISNVFLVDVAGKVVTPPVEMEGKGRLCLPGITRGVVRELAAEAGSAVEERLLTIHDLLVAREVFLTNAVMGVMPVTAVEKHRIAEGTVGAVTQRLMGAYRELVARETAA